MQKIFDGHNDILLRLWLAGDKNGDGFIIGRSDTHIDAPRARKGNLAAGFFAVFAPSGDGTRLDTGRLGQRPAAKATDAMVAIFQNLTRNHDEIISQCHSADEVDAAVARGSIAAILHFEGAEAILPDCSNLSGYYDAGLRSIGPLWSRPNAFGEGVAFDFPGDPDTGNGLTDAGRELIKACENLGIMVDLSHLNAGGFRDIAAITSRPLIATHSNMHARCPSPRNLTDWQLDAIAESGGLAGVNFACAFLREDGAKNPDTPLSDILRHIDGLLDRLGEDGVALGSDFDGAVIPDIIGDCARLPVLADALADTYGQDLTHKICFANWQRQLRLQIG